MNHAGDESISGCGNGGGFIVVVVGVGQFANEEEEEAQQEVAHGPKRWLFSQQKKTTTTTSINFFDMLFQWPFQPHFRTGRLNFQLDFATTKTTTTTRD